LVHYSARLGDLQAPFGLDAIAEPEGP
jgi:hypothetical protein